MDRFWIYRYVLTCLCCDTAVVYLKRFFFFNILARGKNMYPLVLGRILLCFELPGNRSDVRNPKVLIYEFQISRTLVDAQGVIQHPTSTCTQVSFQTHNCVCRFTYVQKYSFILLRCKVHALCSLKSQYLIVATYGCPDSHRTKNELALLIQRTICLIVYKSSHVCKA